MSLVVRNSQAEEYDAIVTVVIGNCLNMTFLLKNENLVHVIVIIHCSL